MFSYTGMRKQQRVECLSKVNMIKHWRTDHAHCHINTREGVSSILIKILSIQLLSKNFLDSDFRHNFLHTQVGFT